MKQPRSGTGVAALTPKERAVLQGIAAGLNNKAIARGLGNSPRTIEVHAARVLDKLGARNRPHAVAIAYGVAGKPLPFTGQ